VSSRHKALLACFSLMVRCVGVVWWLWIFGCIIFLSSSWINFNKWPYASIDVEAGASPFQKNTTI
jgi:hypothetical protein